MDFLVRWQPGRRQDDVAELNQFPAIAYRKGSAGVPTPRIPDFLWDVVPIIKSEIQALLNEGVSYVQIDAPRYSYYLDPKWRDYIRREMGVSPEDALDEAIRVDNACLEGARREGVTLAIHLCRGNNRVSGAPRAGAIRLPGCSTSSTSTSSCWNTTPIVPGRSNRSASCRRTRASSWGSSAARCPRWRPRTSSCAASTTCRYVALHNLAISTQCGFASSLEGNLLTEDEQWQKLQRVVETARKVWADA